MSQQKLLIAEWRKLIMANYEIDPVILKKYLPAGTELDAWGNKYYVSLVGFMVLKTRLHGLRIPFHSDFPEVNLRFYVRSRSRKEWKRGVVFINEFVPKPAITFVANKLYKERFVTCSMKHTYEIDHNLKIGYYWKKDHNWNKLEVTADPNFYELKQGSKEEFIIERYWGCSSTDKNKTEEFQVEHPQWNIYPIEQYNIDCNFKTLYGNDFGPLDHTAPVSVFLAEGSPATIFTKKTL
jgi:uncharacterized protein YqjF (DUF2071 family)